MCFSQQKPGILFTQAWIDKKMAEKLVSDGFEIDVQWNLPSNPDVFKKYNVIVLQKGGAYLKDNDRENLLNYVKDGGGLFIVLYKGEHLNDWFGQFQLLDLINAKLRPETIKDPVNQKSGLTPWFISFASTRNINKHKISEGIERIWYPISEGAGGMSATLPFEVGEEWQIIVKGENTAKTQPWTSNSRGLPPERIPVEMISAPAIFAVRDYGKGRIALCGINSSYHFFGGYSTALMGIVVENGINGEKSDLTKLLLNTLKYLSEPSMKEGRYAEFKTNPKLLEENKLPVHSPLNWNKIEFPLPPKVFKGVVGIQTKISGGKGNIEEFVKKAISSGLDFIVLLEDFTKLTKEKWENLVKDCEKLSDEKFLVVPGFKFQDGYGNNYFAVGLNIRFPDDFLLDENRKFSIYEQQGNKKIPGQVAHNLLEFMHNLNRMYLTIGSYLHSKNPCPYYEMRSYDSVAIFTQDFTKNKPELLDELIEGYAHLQNRGESLWPFAITLIDDPKQIEIAVKEGYLNYFEGRNIDDLKNQLSNWHPAMSGYQHLRFVSNGPKILMWKFVGQRDLETYEWFDWTYWRWRLKLITESDTGLKTVKIYDGNELIRCFYPNGEKIFTWEEDLTHGQQHNLFVVAEDIKGKKCISMELYDRPQPLLEEFMCSDRMNQLSYSMQRRPDGTGSQTGFVWGMTPNKGPWSGAGDLSPCSTYKPDSRLGGMIPGFDGVPWGDPGLSIRPYIKCDKGEEDVDKGRVFTDRILHSADIMMGYGKSDGLYHPDVPALNVWHTLAPCTPLKLFDVFITRTYFNLRPGLLSSIIADLSIAFKENVKIDILKIGSFYQGKATKWYIRTSDGKILSSDKNTEDIKKEKKIELLSDGYIAFCGSPLGSVAVFNLSETPIDIYPGGGSWELRIPIEGKEVKKGEKIDLKILTVGAPFTVEPDEKWIEKIRESMGISKTGYELKIKKGKLLSNKYILQIDGNKEGFSGDIKKSDLPLTLPVIVKNLNERWSSFLLEKNNNRARPIGQFKDTAYVTIDLREGDVGIFVGHPVICDDPEVFINVVQTGDKEFTAYLHNPAERKKDIKVKTNPEWTIGNIQQTSIILNPGEVKAIKF